MTETNPAQLKREINKIQSSLIRSAAPIRQPVKAKNIRRRKIIAHTQPTNQRNFRPDLPNPFLERQRMEELRRASDSVTKRPRKKYQPKPKVDKHKPDLDELRKHTSKIKRKKKT